MLNSGKKISRQKKKYSNSRVVRKTISERKKTHKAPLSPCKLNGRSLNTFIPTHSILSL